jgi:hypothetical protein
MRRSLQVVLFTSVALLAGLPVLAQEQRGAIQGVVRDSQGAAAPGVAVVARSATGLAVETVTDGSGLYRFASLVPGRYEVVARLTGFAPARVVNIDLMLGVQLQIDVTLQPAGLDETIEVVSESPLVAITQSVHATSLHSEEIEKMPRGRDFTSLATQAAGVNNEQKMSGLSIDGSTSAENRVVIDGVETTDIYQGIPGQYLATDFVEELQVKSSGYSAEYGGSTGASSTRSRRRAPTPGTATRSSTGRGAPSTRARARPCVSIRPTRVGPSSSPTPRTRTRSSSPASPWADRSFATSCGSSPATCPRSGRSTAA